MKEGKTYQFGNYSSQMFANVYLNELDQYIKHKLKIKWLFRYMDDVIILVKTKKEALKDFEKAGRQDLIDQTNKEIEILQEYLPKQLSKDEIKAKLEKIISDLGATTMKDMGAIMKEAKVQMGASADGKTINEVAKEIMEL